MDKKKLKARMLEFGVWISPLLWLGELFFAKYLYERKYNRLANADDKSE